jgi:hypothetical protein
VGFYARYKNLAAGLKVDNLGKEFAKDTSIPTFIGMGLKYNIISGTALIAEAKIPDLQINGGVAYDYKTVKLLFGLRYLGAKDMANGMSIGRNSDDLGITAGLMVDIDNYTIGYSMVYGHFSAAHHFSVSLVP